MPGGCNGVQAHADTALEPSSEGDSGSLVPAYSWSWPRAFWVAVSITADPLEPPAAGDEAEQADVDAAVAAPLPVVLAA